MNERKLFQISVIIAIVLFVALVSTPVREAVKKRIEKARFEEGVKIAKKHMKILWKALQQYRRDWDGKLPITLGALYPKYISAKEIFVHPLDKKRGQYVSPLFIPDRRWYLEHKELYRKYKGPIVPHIRTSFMYYPYFWLVPFNQWFLPAEEFYKDILPRKDFRILGSRIIKWVGNQGYELVCFSDGRIGWGKWEWDYSYGRKLRNPEIRQRIERLKRRGVRLPETLVKPPPEVFKPLKFRR